MSAILNLPDIRPSLLLDFVNSGLVDPRLYGQRQSNATLRTQTGQHKTVGPYTPRIDYDPLTGKCLGYLSEEARTNLLASPLDMKATAWISLPGATVDTADSQGFFKITHSGTDSYKSVYAIGTASLDGTASTFSLEVKKGSLSVITVLLACDTTGAIGGRAIYNLSTGTIVYGSPSTAIPLSSISGTIKQTGVDTFLISLTVDFAGQSTGYNGRVYLYPGNYRLQTNGDIYVRHPFLEIGRFPTSFIGGQSGSVTRAFEQLRLPVSSDWFNQSEGTFVCSYSRLSDKGLGNQIPFMVSNGTTENIMCISDGPNGVADRALAIFNGSSATLGSVQSYAAGQIMARTIRYKGRSVATCVNGGAISSAVAGADALPFSTLTVGYAPYFTSSRANGHVRHLAYYPIALTDAQMQRMTTL